MPMFIRCFETHHIVWYINILYQIPAYKIILFHFDPVDYNKSDAAESCAQN